MILWGDYGLEYLIRRLGGQGVCWGFCGRSSGIDRWSQLEIETEKNVHSKVMRDQMPGTVRLMSNNVARKVATAANSGREGDLGYNCPCLLILYTPSGTGF